MYSLLALFFVVPLYFSHVLVPFGIVFGDSSFERQKVYLVMIFVVLGILESVVRFPENFRQLSKKYGYIFLLLLLFPFLGILGFHGSGDFGDLLIGSHEKHHGYFFFATIVAYLFLLGVSPKIYYYQYLRASMYAGIIVCLIAIGERMGGIFDIYGISDTGSDTGSYPGRSGSTLGNPNYLAGYILILFPFIKFMRDPERWIVFAIFTFALFASGSYIGIGILLVYFFFLLFEYLEIPRKYFMICLLIGFLAGIMTIQKYISHDKLLSFISRGVLMKESIILMWQHPLSFIFGFGPESTALMYSGNRSAIINNYFPIESTIDSSHNIFLDILFQYGFIPLLFLVWKLREIWKNQSPETHHALIMSSIFLGLNVIVVTHILLILFITLIPREIHSR